MKKIYFLLFSCFISNFLFAQKETNHWALGYCERIDFNETPPQPSSFQYYWTCDFSKSMVAQSDTDGKALFFSDGNFLLNHKGQDVFWGFDGGYEGSQSVFSIPVPNTINQYYLLTAAISQDGDGLQWAKIDVEDNDFPQVISSNNIITNNSIGKVTAVQHSNLKDAWIISHDLNSNIFHAWLATEDSISTTPVSSNIGSVIMEGGDTQGQLKVSINGNLIANVSKGLNTVEVFDFNRATGVLSNPVILEDFNSPYGMEFSPNGKFLYVNQYGNDTTSNLVQLDFYAGDVDAILDSKVDIGSNEFIEENALQLASDGKIYTVNYWYGTMNVINNPDSSGLGCNFETDVLFSYAGGYYMGLPVFYHKYFQKKQFNYTGFCLGGITEFQIDQFEFPIDSVQWDFGDPNSGLDNFSNEISPSHQFSSSGSFPVILTIYFNEEIIYTGDDIHIAPTEIDIGTDTIVCADQQVTIDGFLPNANYLWSTGDTTSSINATEEGLIWAEISVDTCDVLIDSLWISHLPIPTANLGEYIIACHGDTVVFDVTNVDLEVSYFWSTSETTPVTDISLSSFPSATSRWVEVTASNGCVVRDTVGIFFYGFGVTSSQKNVSCFGEDEGIAKVFLQSANISGFQYDWSTGDTLYWIDDLVAGDYSVTITGHYDCTEEEEFTIIQPTEINVYSEIVDDDNDTPNPDGWVRLNPDGGTPPYTYRWHDIGELSDDMRLELFAGDYLVTVTDANDCEVVLDLDVGGDRTELDNYFLEQIEVYPNPTSNFMYIKTPFDSNDDLEFLMFNVLGQELSDFFKEKNGELITFDISNLSTGIYIFKIKKGEEERTWKVNVIK